MGTSSKRPPALAPARPGETGLRVATARTPGEVEALRAVWVRLQTDALTSDLDFALAVVRTDPAVERPHVLLAERDGEPAAILVGRLERLRLPARLGYATLHSPALLAIRVVYGGLLGEPADDVLDALIGELRRSLDRAEAAVVVFRELRVGSPLHRAVRRSAPWLLRDHLSRQSVHRELALPPTLDEFLGSLSKSTRDGVRRYRNRVERELGDRLEVRLFRHPEEIDELAGRLEAVAALSWQRGLGAGFRADEPHRARTLLALERGWYRACLVSVDGRPVAFWQGQGCRGRITSGIPGFDPAFGAYRIGTYALLRLIESLCKDPEVRVLDFGFGDAEYKRRFATSSWQEQTVAIFAPRPLPVLVNGARTAIAGTNEALRFLLGRLGLLARVRTSWRGFLAGRDRGRPGAGAV